MKRPFRMIIWMLCVLMCVPLLSAAVLADDGVDGGADEPAVLTSGDFDYIVNENGTVTITACSPDAAGKVQIPSKIDGKKVTALGDRAFVGCEKMTEVSIPNGIKTIGKECFLGCPLTKISLPASVETINSAAFSTSTLTSVSVNKNNKNFSSNKGVLFNKKQTSVVCFPAGKTGSYTLPTSVKTIRARSFEGSALTELKLSGKGKLATINSGAFSGSALTKISLPKTVTELGKGVFSDCTSLTSVKLPDTITQIPDSTFSGCSALTGLQLSSKVTSVGASAFSGSGLKSITFPSSVKDLGDRAFAGCEDLKEIVFDHDDKNALTFGKEVFACSGDTDTTVRVPDPQSPTAIVSGYDWASDHRTVTWAQNEDFEVRTVALAGAESVDGGVKISWNAIEEAEGYIIYRKASKDDKWSKLSTSSKTSYKDTKVSSGKTYYYTVRAEKGDSKSKYDPDGVKVKYIAIPPLYSVNNTAAGAVVNWGKVGGVTKYRVFRKVGDGSWARIIDTSSTSYTDSNVIVGTKYTYTVRCISDDGGEYLSDYNHAGLSTVYYPLPTPSVSKLTASDNGVKVEWAPVKGAAKYRVFRKTGNGNWGRIVDTSDTSFQDTSANMGTAYTYTVRCISADGTAYLSDYTGGASITRVGTPVLSSVSNVNGGVEIKWGKVSGAAGYRVFRKSGSDGWKGIGDTTATSFIDKSAKSGTTYTYTVRCITSGTKFYSSDHDHVGKSIAYVAAPPLQTPVGTGNGVQITWTGVRGAAKYRVFRRPVGGTWQIIGDSSGTSFTDSTAVPGNSYNYTVRCVTADGTAFTSDYDHAGRTITFASTPALQSVQKVSGGVQITWSKATGAVKYRVFRKTASSNWNALGETTGTSWVDKTVTNGTFTYTVRPISSDNKCYTGGHGPGLTITYTK